ncbi:MAG: NTP transferase domain-containing protein [bacterium]|nr:NTP transferase domain-containing protein [bacterium]
MRNRTIPLIVLAGSDRRPAELPSKGRGKRPVWGSKGVAIKIGGRPLIDLLLERLRECGYFDPIYIGGPAAVYGELHDGVPVIDTDSSFGKNIQVALETVEKEFPASPLAMTTCDILPEVEELRRLMEDYLAHEPLDFWFPLILVPENPQRLGASAWKPQYGVVTEPGREPIFTLPGHLVVVYPPAFRRSLLYRSFELAYSSRNRSPWYRFCYMLPRVLYILLGQDLQRILRFRPPTVSLAVLWNGIAIARSLKAGNMVPEEMAERISRVFGRRRHRKRFPDQLGRLALVDALSMAKDIDTEEEAEETGRGFGS